MAFGTLVLSPMSPKFEKSIAVAQLLRMNRQLQFARNFPTLSVSLLNSNQLRLTEAKKNFFNC